MRLADRCRAAECSCRRWGWCRHSSDRHSAAADCYKTADDVVDSPGHRLTRMTMMTTDRPLHTHTHTLSPVRGWVYRKGAGGLASP